MSEKKEKQERHQILLPHYNIQEQVQFILKLCDDMDFKAEDLLSYILADWILTFQQATDKMNGSFRHAFLAYLSTCKNTSDNLLKLKEVIEHGKKTKDSDNAR